MTSRRPARAAPHEIGVIHFAYEKLPRSKRVLSLHLRVAFQAEVIVPLRKELPVY
jgi:hypothetical protein